MLTARGKKNENIAEYILYMWHIEDQIRAFGLDIDRIQVNIIDKYEQPENVRTEIREWYESLIDMMKLENVTENGHIQMNKNVVNELTELHESLLASPKESMYTMTYYKVLPLIVELRSKAGGHEYGEIETCLNLMYGILVLRLQQREISKGTLAAANQISEYLKFLAIKYRQDKEEELEL